MPVSISPQEFENNVLNEVNPVLLVCLRKDGGFLSQLEAIEEVCRELGGGLDVYLLDEDYITTYWKRYGIKGTPTFMIFCDGRGVAKLLGRASALTLNRFIQDYLKSREAD